MNTKNKLLIMGAFLLLIGSVSAFQFDSSLTGRGHSSASLLSHASANPQHSGPSVIGVEPKQPNTSPFSSMKDSSPSFGSSRGSGMSSYELEKVLTSNRVYDPINRKWMIRAWTPLQKENLVMSWTYRGKEIGVKRPSAGRLYYNKMEE